MDFEVQANLTDGVAVSAKDVDLPSKMSSAQLFGYRSTQNWLLVSDRVAGLAIYP